VCHFTLDSERLTDSLKSGVASHCRTTAIRVQSNADINWAAESGNAGSVEIVRAQAGGCVLSLLASGLSKAALCGVRILFLFLQELFLLPLAGFALSSFIMLFPI
jgi:hypothetical protein